MHDDINTKRTELANQMAAAGAAALDFNATAAVLAATPDTEPQQYVAAGTPENIAAILPATISPARRMRHGDRPTEALVFDEPAATSGDAPADLQQLKALALAATPGPWELQLVENGGIKHLCPADADGMSILTVVHQDETPFGAVYNDSDAEFIAAANPAVVLDLIARIERLTEVADELESFYRDALGNRHSDLARIERAASPATASGDELPSLSDFDYQEILGPVLSREGMRRYRNGDPLNLDPSDLRAMIDRARAAVSAATKPTADLSKLTRYYMKAVGMSVVDMKADPSGKYFKVEDVQSLLAAPSPQIAEKVEDTERLLRAGRNLHELAKRMGWPDDGEGAYEYVQRLSYELGQSDAIAASRRASSLPDVTMPEPTRQPNVTMLQFLTDVVTAAGLLAHGKRDKVLARRIADRSYEIRFALHALEGNAWQAPLLLPEQAGWVDKFGNVWPLAAYSTNGKPSYHDAHKRDWQPVYRLAAQPAEASAGQAGQVAKLADALNTMLWLYRRLPGAYGKPPFVDAALIDLAAIAGVDGVPEAIKERATLLDATHQPSAKVKP